MTYGKILLFIKINVTLSHFKLFFIREFQINIVSITLILF
jgi:hypothetical protein